MCPFLDLILTAVRLRLHGAVKGGVWQRTRLMVLDKTGGGRGVGSDCVPGAGHGGGALQAVSEVGNAFEIDDVTASAVRRQVEPGSRSKTSENISRPGERCVGVALVAIHTGR